MLEAKCAACLSKTMKCWLQIEFSSGSATHIFFCMIARAFWSSESIEHGPIFCICGVTKFPICCGEADTCVLVWVVIWPESCPCKAACAFIFLKFYRLCLSGSSMVTIMMLVHDAKSWDFTMKIWFPINNGKREISSIFSDHQASYKRSAHVQFSKDQYTTKQTINQFAIKHTNNEKKLKKKCIPCILWRTNHGIAGLWRTSIVIIHVNRHKMKR